MKTSLLTRFSLLGVLILAGLLGVDSIAAAGQVEMGDPQVESAPDHLTCVFKNIYTTKVVPQS